MALTILFRVVASTIATFIIPFSEVGLIVGVENYRNTKVDSSLGERIFINFERIRFASRKIEFLDFCFLAKKSIKMTLNVL